MCHASAEKRGMTSESTLFLPLSLSFVCFFSLILPFIHLPYSVPIFLSLFLPFSHSFRLLFIVAHLLSVISSTFAFPLSPLLHLPFIFIFSPFLSSPLLLSLCLALLFPLCPSIIFMFYLSHPYLLEESFSHIPSHSLPFSSPVPCPRVTLTVPHTHEAHQETRFGSLSGVKPPLKLVDDYLSKMSGYLHSQAQSSLKAAQGRFYSITYQTPKQFICQVMFLKQESTSVLI